MGHSAMNRRRFLGTTAPAVAAVGLAGIVAGAAGAEPSAESLQLQAAGTLLRGPDGALYLIPDEKLAALRLPDEKAYEIRKLSEQGGVMPLVSLVRGPVGKRLGIAASDTTTVSIVNIGAFRALKF